MSRTQKPMAYSIHQLAKLADISVRTLHHYDAIGLLRPVRSPRNSYRKYEEKDLLKLQQILFFRELEFPLLEIKQILENPSFDTPRALRDQKKLIELKQKRLEGIVRTIEKTIYKVTKNKPMKDEELYNSLNKDEMEQYAKEAKERWGNTDAYKESQKRVAKITKADMARIQKEGDTLMKEIAKAMQDGNNVKSEIVQKLIAQHYNNLRHFYEPNLEMYRGLGEMYVSDPRFTEYFEKYAKGLAVFMRDAMTAYCESKK